MAVPQQSTIARRVAWTGTGLHGGERIEIALCPGEVDTGIVFVSLGAGSDGGDVEIPARAANVLSSSRATTLAAAAGGVVAASGSATADDAPEGAAPVDRPTSVATVEHLLATLYVLSIDNIRIELRGAEIPAMDGSAVELLEQVRGAGRCEQAAPQRALTVRQPLVIEEGDRSIRVDPSDQLRISYAIDFAHPCIGRQSLEIAEVGEGVFDRELARARTFGFVHELAALHDAGLAHGGSFENAIVLDETRVLNADGLRWPDEFVRHKVIDLLGDLALLGMRLVGHVRVEKGGHRLHHHLVRALLDREGLDQPAKSSSSRASAAVLAGSVN